MLDVLRHRRGLTASYELVPGVRVEPIGEGWVAYSPASGETMFLNPESVAILDILGDGARTSRMVCELLSVETGLAAIDLEPTVDESWPRLIEAGLVRYITRTTSVQ